MKKNKGFIKIKREPDAGRSLIYYLPAETRKIIHEQIQLFHLLDSVDTILLVDDEEIVQITIKRILKKLGYSVFTADNGKEAIELYKQFKNEINLILLDLAMPVMSGDDALTEILKINPDAKIILFSGYDEVEVSRRLKSNTIVGFIEKPVLIDELGKRVQELFPQKD
jgi:two-component system cell cycle sensor histidine kinase/response regulator CckA